MSNLRQAAQQALVAMKSANHVNYSWACVEAVAVLEAALKKADEDRAWVEERKANWAEDKALAQRNALEEADRIRKAEEEGRCWACGQKAEQEQEPVLLECVTCGTVYADGVPPQVPEDIAQDWDLLKATQESLREHMAEIQRLRAALAEQDQELVVDCPRCGHCCPQQTAEQEPVAWMSPSKERLEFSTKSTVYGSHTIPLYTSPPQRKPLTDEQVNECGMCGYVGKDKDKTGQCPKCRWDELRPLTGKAHQKPLTDDQIYEMYNEPRSDAEMLEFARAIEAAHGIKGEA